MSKKSIKKKYEKEGLDIDDNLVLIDKINSLEIILTINEVLLSYVYPNELNECNNDIINSIYYLYNNGICDKKTKFLLLLTLLSKREYISNIGIKVLNKVVDFYEPYKYLEKQNIINFSKKIVENINLLNKTRLNIIETFIDSGRTEIELDKLKKYKKEMTNYKKPSHFLQKDFNRLSN